MGSTGGNQGSNSSTAFLISSLELSLGNTVAQVRSSPALSSYLSLATEYFFGLRASIRGTCYVIPYYRELLCPDYGVHLRVTYGHMLSPPLL
jgi:hypothetical protein